MKGATPSLFRKDFSIYIRLDESMAMAIEQLALTEYGGCKSKAIRAMIKEYMENHKSIE